MITVKCGTTRSTTAPLNVAVAAWPNAGYRRLFDEDKSGGGELF